MGLATGKSAGKALTSDRNSVQGKVKSWAKRHRVDNFDEAEGWRALNGTRLQSPDGIDVINNDDKSADLLRFTDVGNAVLSALKSDPVLQSEITRHLTKAPSPTEPWFPIENGPDASIRMRIESAMVAEPAKYDVIAEFECERCDQHLRHRYSVVLPDDLYSGRRVTTTCACGLSWSHETTNPFRPATTE
jgi:hypothetical protein